ncbi:hypothetical protein ABEG17_00140 [Pedococcus sp. KACC 23699]|uniref:Oxalate:formate antiporter n=1 Tax=Pedococcus sp. KACC 23699 TaxID=3149228 RepID=A0AAU7JZB5_9MICO
MSDTRSTAPDTTHSGHSAVTTSPLVVTAAWLVVGTPLAYGLWQTILKAAKLFGG